MDNKDLKSVKVNFNLRPASENSKDTALNCVIRWDKQRLVVSNVERINPVYWNKKKQTAGKFTGHAEFNTRLENIEKDIKEVYRTYINDNNQYPTISIMREGVKNKLAGIQPAKIVPLTFFSHIQEYIQTASVRENKVTERKLAPVTIRVYNQVYNVLREFAEYRGKAINFEGINLAFYENYKSFLQYNKGYAKNTVGKHIRVLKGFLNDARTKGIDVHVDLKHQNFKGITENVKNIYLDESELTLIACLDLSDPNKFVEITKGGETSKTIIRVSFQSLDRVRDLFLIGCYTGLRFSDFTSIPKQSIDLKNRLISIKTQKTNKPVVIPIHKTVLSILNKYHDKTENSLPPALSNAKMNEYLKGIADLAGLNEIISKSKTIAGKEITRNYQKWELVCTHTARRSFASNSYKMGIPVYTIMGITGHTSEKTFKNYVKLDETEHARIIAGYWNRQELRKVD
ncbi:MAG TPA: site-specific integrase [Sphingobacteriaceae bacterium]|nr:site-specific integrase [Sphingobacteriaceae bacterium]